MKSGGLSQIGAKEPDSLNLNQEKDSKAVTKTKKDISKMKQELKRNGIEIDTEMDKSNDVLYKRDGDNEDGSSDDEVTHEKRLAQRDHDNVRKGGNSDDREENEVKRKTEETMEKFEKVRREHHQKTGIAQKMNLTHDGE